MKLRYKITGGVLLFIALAVTALAITISRDAPCATAPALAADAQRMKAAVNRCYGSPDVVKVEDIEKPTPKDHEILVKVRAASVNPLDWHLLRGQPYIMRAEAGIGVPGNSRLGVDYAGTVEAVGKDVTRFKAGDEIFGSKRGAFAEYVSVPDERAIALKPANVTFEQAAAVPVAAVTALQALRDHGKVQAGQKVLINGASGGVGTYAVQIAKSLGAEVTAVCSTRNVPMVQALGADHVIDYKSEDYTQGAQHYDVIIDTVGNRSLLENKRVMADKGIFVIVGGPSDGKFIGAMWSPVKAWMLSPFVSQQFGFFLADVNQKDLDLLHDMMQAGKLTSIIDRSYQLGETAEAIRYLEAGHARGKVIIAMD
ncbi:MAG TPA: NAD(P)-dependent alcohol dehydrogenase [Steroidobacteraceae bacterium]|nr:NAD(P)-dependent alcohol dehydrogenase [Steroidobacteraceae bacterium]